MKKKIPEWLIWVSVIILCFIIISFCLGDNKALAAYFPLAILSGIIGVEVIKSLINTAKERKKIKELRSKVPQIEVHQVKPPFPVYSFDSAFLGILFSFFGIGIVFYGLVILRNLNPLFIFKAIEAAGAILLIYGGCGCIAKIRTKALSFYQDDPSVSLYEKDAIKNYIHSVKSMLNNSDSKNKTDMELFPIERLRSYLANEYETFLSKKCEHIRFYNETEFWSCYTKDLNGGDRYYTRKKNYIFAMIPFQSQTRYRILICNNEKSYFHQNDLYIPKYSNLPPFVKWGENVEQVCEKIEAICSEFAAKTRSAFVIEITNGKIYIGLRNARFGKQYRIFNKALSKEQTKQAIEEITEFLQKIKAIVEPY